MHGANHDVEWLQRDFSVYVVNLFDTGQVRLLPASPRTARSPRPPPSQAARLLTYPSFSLAYLLEHHCGVHPDKSNQRADWRIRPLPPDMLKYAREDTHYLLYVYDLLRAELHAKGRAQRRDMVLECLVRARARGSTTHPRPHPVTAPAEAEPGAVSAPL